MVWKHNGSWPEALKIFLQLVFFALFWTKCLPCQPFSISPDRVVQSGHFFLNFLTFFWNQFCNFFNPLKFLALSIIFFILRHWHKKSDSRQNYNRKIYSFQALMASLHYMKIDFWLPNFGLQTAKTENFKLEGFIFLKYMENWILDQIWKIMMTSLKNIMMLSKLFS